MKRRKTLALAAAGAGFVLALTACGSNSANNTSSGSGGSNNSGPKVGVILPETATSARWAGFDQPMLQSALTKAGLNPIIETPRATTSGSRRPPTACSARA